MSAASAFACRRCGQCCRGEGGIVADERDQQRLCAYLGAARETFLAAYTVERSGKVFLTVGADGNCVFFEAGCGVHPARPDICRAWPFFRGNLIDAVSFALSKDSCPGIEQGASHAAFARQGAAYLQARGLVKSSQAGAAEALKLSPAMLAAMLKADPDDA
ncbi:MAG: YkgJ family cysteine cluster protein [Desulfovibrionaceae bacterium]|nr:YkgJ family cysteine cluster protein [Desulfovibrionaceae bacterium]MBF0513814.1 YkgJ family cysteine cluster protein [Desulfovibrionaceae bacterium]